MGNVYEYEFGFGVFVLFLGHTVGYIVHWQQDWDCDFSGAWNLVDIGVIVLFCLMIPLLEKNHVDQ